MAKYGVSETNPLEGQYNHDQVRGSVDWTDSRLKTVIRFRLIGDPGYDYLDVSYCHGELHDGRLVNVGLPFSDLPKRGWKKQLVRFAMRDKVYAQGLGLFDNVSILV